MTTRLSVSLDDAKASRTHIETALTLVRGVVVGVSLLESEYGRAIAAGDGASDEALVLVKLPSGEPRTGDDAVVGDASVGRVDADARGRPARGEQARISRRGGASETMQRHTHRIHIVSVLAQRWSQL